MLNLMMKLWRSNRYKQQHIIYGMYFSNRACCIQEKPYWYDGVHIIPSGHPGRASFGLYSLVEVDSGWKCGCWQVYLSFSKSSSTAVSFLNADASVPALLWTRPAVFLTTITCMKFGVCHDLIIKLHQSHSLWRASKNRVHFTISLTIFAVFFFYKLVILFYEMTEAHQAQYFKSWHNINSLTNIEYQNEISNSIFFNRWHLRYNTFLDGDFISLSHGLLISK